MALSDIGPQNLLQKLRPKTPFCVVGTERTARWKRSAGSTFRSCSRVRGAALPDSIPGSAGARVVAELLRAEGRRDARLHVRTEPPPLKTKRIEKVPGCRRTDGRSVRRPDVSWAGGLAAASRWFRASRSVCMTGF